jgi:hypothetical protein
MILAVAQEPGFTDGTGAGQRCREQVGQSPAAPWAVLANRRKPQGVQRHRVHSGTAVGHVSFLGQGVFDSLGLKLKSIFCAKQVDFINTLVMKMLMAAMIGPTGQNDGSANSKSATCITFRYAGL